MNTLICFISHTINEKLIERFNEIKSAAKLVSGNYDVKYISPNTDITDSNIFIYHLNINESLKDENNRGSIKNHLIYLEIFKNFKGYDYYWLIENDVTINNENRIDAWQIFFNFYNNNNDDLICSKLYKYILSKYHIKRYPKYLLNKYKNNLYLYDLWFGFFPICRISNKLLKYVEDFYKNNDGFFEYVIPTIAYLQKLKISSLSVDKFDYEIPILKIRDINRGSISYTNRDMNNYRKKYPINTIIHPNKL